MSVFEKTFEVSVEKLLLQIASRQLSHDMDVGYGYGRNRQLADLLDKALDGDYIFADEAEAFIEKHGKKLDDMLGRGYWNDRDDEERLLFFLRLLYRGCSWHSLCLWKNRDGSDRSALADAVRG